MKNENSEKNESIIISQNSSNDFLLLFSDIKQQTKLLKSFTTFINEYYDLINVFYKQLAEITNNYLNEDKFNSSTENLPIFRLGKIIREIVQSQINSLANITENENIFKNIDKDFNDLIKIINEYKNISGTPSKGNNKPKSQIQPVVLSLMETYNDIEYKIVNDYIINKYNKRIFGEKKNIELDTKLMEAQYLEKTFLEFEETSKKIFFNDFQEIQKKTLNSFSIIKEHMKIMAEIILKQNYTNLYEIENKIEFMGKNPQLKNNEDANKNNSNTPGVNDNLFKHRINILMNPNIKVIDIEKEKHKNELLANNIANNETKEKHKKPKKSFFKKNKNKEKNDEKEQKPEEDNLEEDLCLKEKDIYNIIEKLYNLNLKMIDKSRYILDEEKKKLEVEKLGKKLLGFYDDDKIPDEINDDEVNCLLELLNNNEANIHKFFILLNNYRTTGRYEISIRIYNILVLLFNKALDLLLDKRNKSLENLIIILPQTFYIKKDNKKCYIINEIKSHKILKSEEFWKNQIKIKIEEQLEKTKKDIKRMNLHLSEKDFQKRKDEIILSQFVPFSGHMKDYELNNDIILKITNKVFEDYSTGEETKALILSLLKN